MSENLPFIVPVFRRENDGSGTEFLGTGILLTPTCVLTCLHVVSKNWTRRSPAGSIAFHKPIAVRIGVEDAAWHGASPVDRERDVDVERDLALLRLSSPCEIGTPHFLAGLTDEVAHWLKGRQVCAFGYPREGGGDRLGSYDLQAVLSGKWHHSNEVFDIQTEGGVREGVSGGPALVRLADQTWACIGVVFLGGAAARSSRLTPSDEVLAFLRRAGVEPRERRLSPHELLPEPPRGVSLWKNSDQPPATVQPGKVLTGQSVRMEHLREGYFADRPAVYDSLKQAAVRWLEDCQAGNDVACKVPIFWIAGRSGAGKSVALVHLLARLHREGHGPILFLGSNPRLLLDAVPWCVKHVVDRQAIIAIDDPYAPRTEQGAAGVWENMLAEVDSLRQNGDSDRLPVLVCCGPTEQAAQLRRDFGLSVDIHCEKLLSEADGQELAQLRDWFQRRTGKRPRQDDDEENVLLVQRVWEWHALSPDLKGLKDFALRFRKRIEDPDPERSLAPFICRVLALNRLYVGYPREAMEALTPKQEGLLEQLIEESHFQEEGEEGRKGLWFAHPHLANRIYDTWDDHDSDRRGHLQGAISDCFRYGATPEEKTAPLWGISAALGGQSGQEGPSGRISPESAAKLLPRVYREWVEQSPGGLPLSLLHVWIRLAASLPGLSLTPNPADTATDRLAAGEADEGEYRDACHSLLQHLDTYPLPRRERTFGAIVQLLQDKPAWPDWHLVALDALRRTGDRQIRGLAVEWLRRHRAHSAWATLWTTLWNLFPEEADRAELRPEGVQWLESAQQRGRWIAIWEMLYRPDGDAGEQSRLSSLGVAWLLQARSHKRWAFVWESLWKTQPDEQMREALLQRGMSWLDQAPLVHGGWSFVWEYLWEEVSKKPKQTKKKKKKEKEGDGPPGPEGVKADSTPSNAEEVRRQRKERLAWAGFHWLGTTLDLDSWILKGKSWVNVRRLLWQEDSMPELRASLIKQGRKCLRQDCPNPHLWALVWGQMWGTELEPEERWSMVNRAYTRLRTSPDSPLWDSVKTSFWKGSEEARRARRDMALGWLNREKLEHGLWAFIWRLAWESKEAGEARESLLGLARRWLARAPEKQATIIRGEVCLHEKRPEERARLLDKWCRRLPEFPRETTIWVSHWLAFWAASEAEPDGAGVRERLAEAALRRLEQPLEEVRGWGDIWLTLWRASEAAPPVRQRLAAVAPACGAVLARHDEGDVLSGRVTGQIKAALLVEVEGALVVLPASQTASGYQQRRAPLEDYLGQTIECKILTVDESRRTFIVSRRKLLEDQREQSKKKLLGELEAGQVRKGVVRNVEDFGAFVDLGGIDGLLHITDMDWRRIHNAREKVQVDQELEVYILSVDREREKIALSLKHGTPSPWTNAEAKYPVGSRHRGQVVKFMSYGAFVELEPGVEGLVHISEMTWTRRINHPSEVVTQGEAVEVQVLNLNTKKDEISLGMKQCHPNPWPQLAERYPGGKVVSGVVRNLTSYGAFIEIEGGIDGLLHIGDMSWVKKVAHPSEVVQVGDRVTCVVLGVDQERKRIPLGLKQTEHDPWERDIPGRYLPGAISKGKVTKLTNFGVFVELEPGLEGLLHRSELADDTVKNPEEVVKVGEEIEVKILRVDPVDRKIGLSIRCLKTELPQDGGPSPLAETTSPEPPGSGEETDPLTRGR